MCVCARVNDLSRVASEQCGVREPTRHLLIASTFKGIGTNFGVGVGEARPEGPRAGDGVLGEGQPAPLHQVVGLQ